MSQTKVLKFSREAKRFAEEYGFKNVTIGRLKHHPVLQGTINGRSVSVVLPRKEECVREKQNLLARLRRLSEGRE